MCWCRCGATRTVTMKASTQFRHQRGHAAMSSSTTTALSRRPLVQVLKERGRSQGPAGCALRLAHGPVPGRDRGAGRLPQPDSDMGAHHGPDRRRPTVSGTEGGAGSSVGVDDPASAPGPGPRRPQHPPGVMVVHAYRHHREAQGGHGGR